MIKKYVVVFAIEIPDDIPHWSKLKSNYRVEEGMKVGFQKMDWVKERYWDLWFEHASGTIKRGASIECKGEIRCHTFSRKKMAMEHVDSYINNPHCEEGMYRKMFIVTVVGVFNWVCVMLAVRHVLKEKFDYKNFYGGLPFVRELTFFN